MLISCKDVVWWKPCWIQLHPVLATYSFLVKVVPGKKCAQLSHRNMIKITVCWWEGCVCKLSSNSLLRDFSLHTFAILLVKKNNKRQNEVLTVSFLLISNILAWSMYWLERVVALVHIFDIYSLNIVVGITFCSQVSQVPLSISMASAMKCSTTETPNDISATLTGFFKNTENINTFSSRTFSYLPELLSSCKSASFCVVKQTCYDCEDSEGHLGRIFPCGLRGSTCRAVSVLGNITVYTTGSWLSKVGYMLQWLYFGRNAQLW